MVISPFTQKAEQIIGREGETATLLPSQKRALFDIILFAKGQIIFMYLGM
jgi:hypothetical protein